MAAYSSASDGYELPGYRVYDRRRHIDVTEVVVNSAVKAAHEFQAGKQQVATGAGQCGGISGATAELKSASKVLRDFLSNPRVANLLAAHDKHVDYPELEKFLGELDYIEELSKFTKKEAIAKLSAIRTALANKRTRPGRAEWVTLTGNESDEMVKDLRKCIAVLGLA